MIDFDDIKDEIDELILIDTNVLINLEHRQCSNIDLKAISHLINNDCRPLLTELSFCELVIGCTNINDFIFHIKELDDMEFILCGFNEKLGSFLSNNNYNLIKSDEYFIKFKNELIDIRDDVLFPCFYKILFLYSKLSCILLVQTDCEYWKEAVLTFEKFYNEFNAKYFDLVKVVYKEFINDKKLVQELFISVIVQLISLVEITKYKISDLESIIRNLLTKKKFSEITGFLNIKTNEGANGMIKNFIIKFRNQITIKNDEELVNDGICYLVYKMVFNGANFNSHDLIDIMNIGFASKNVVTTHYYTNDVKRWKDFIEIEKVLRPNKKILLNH